MTTPSRTLLARLTAIMLSMPVVIGIDSTVLAQTVFESGTNADREDRTPVPCDSNANRLFYGIAGHTAQGGPYDRSSDSAQLSLLRELGMTVYAIDVWDTRSAQRVAELARAASYMCIEIVPVVVHDFPHTSDEGVAYSEGRVLGARVAKALYGLSRYYQVGNECDAQVVTNGDGNGPGDYDNQKFTLARGSIDGMIDGIKSVDASAKILMCSTSWLHYGFTDMLYRGTQPDGTSGHSVPRWDITAWHWYSDMGDITDAHGINVLQHLRDTYHKPIWITEFGARPGLLEADAALYLTGRNGLSGFVASARAYHIESVILYELYDDQADGGDGNYGLVKNDAMTKKPRFDVIRRFIQTHLMP